MSAESFADWEVENYEIFHGIPDMGYLEFECPVERPELDACGNCYEFTDSEGYTSDSSGCDDDDDLLGDINADGTLNILDVVTIVNLVMSGEYDVVAFKQTFINPRIIEETGEKWDFNEGCLSIPEVREDITQSGY